MRPDVCHDTRYITAASSMPRASRDKFAVYLMRKGNQFRIGKCKMEYAQASGPVARMRHEEADAVWILSLHASEEEA